MTKFSCTVTEHDLKKPWIVLGTGTHTIELDAGTNFYEWARERWPHARYTVRLDQGQEIIAT
jgi:hypothetical protein